MRMTKRDVEILKFINEMGYCQAVQLGKRFSVKRWRVYKIMKRLRVVGLVIHKRIYFDQAGIFYLTSDGAEYTSLPSVDHIAKGSYDHQLLLVDVVLKLRERYSDATLICERYLKQEKFMYGLGKKGHVADGILIFSDQKRVAIELELKSKGTRRLESILKSYGNHPEIDEAWYLCGDESIRKVTALSAKKPYIKVYSLKEFLQ